MPQTQADYLPVIRTLIRDDQGGTATPDPTQYVFPDSELLIYLQVAVSEYTTWRKRRRPYTLNLLQNQDTYTLPDDWILRDEVSFEAAISPPEGIDFYRFAGFVLPTLNGSIPLYDLGWDFYDSDKTLIITPPPTVNAGLNFAYFATHTVNSTSSTIPAQDLNFVAALAGAKALRALATEKGQKMQKYKIGRGLQIDDSEVPKHLEALAEKLCSIFDDNVKLRPYGEAG